MPQLPQLEFNLDGLCRFSASYLWYLYSRSAGTELLGRCQQTSRRTRQRIQETVSQNPDVMQVRCLYYRRRCIFRTKPVNAGDKVYSPASFPPNIDVVPPSVPTNLPILREEQQQEVSTF
jgi:hypothetical protein